MILAAGRGTRLAPLTESMPKPMIPISSEPLIVHQIRWLHRGGVREIVINLHHLGEQIRSRLGSGGDLGVKIHYSDEPALLDTGGGIKNALHHFGDAPFLVLNGDLWTNYRFKDLVSSSIDGPHLVLVPATEGREASFFMAGDQVRRGAENDLTFASISVVNRRLFDGTPDTPFSMRDLYFAAADAGTLTGEIFTGTWIDIGTHDALKAVRRLTL